MKKSKQFFTLTLILLLFSCGSAKKSAGDNMKGDEKNTVGKTYLISAPIVEKQRTIKGEIQAVNDYFLERSIQDYFIKFCESDVSRAELEANLDKQRATMKVLHAEIEYREGDWDSCDINGKVASRTGAYIVIKRLVK